MSQGAVKPRSTTGSSPASSDSGAVHITLPQRRTDGADQPRRMYLAGTTLDCPIQNVDVRGVSFQRFTGGRPVFEDRVQVTRGVDGDTQRTRVSVNDARKLGAARWGCLIELTDKQVEAVQKDVADKVVTVVRDHTGRASRARIKNVNSPRFKSSPNDVPLGHYLYLVARDAASAEHADTGEYPRMLRDWED